MRQIPILCLCAAFMFCLTVQQAAAQGSVNVSTPQGLEAALADMTDGGEIVLAGGDYGDLVIRNLSAPRETPLVLRAATPSDPPRLSRLTLQDTGHIALDGFFFDYTFDPDDPPHLRPFRILSSTGIGIRNSLFDGDVARGRGPADDGFGTAFGLGITGSAEVTLDGNEIRGFYRGLVVNGSRNVTVQRNDLHDIRMDGMNFAQVEDVVIAHNHIHDFSRSLDSKDHADMIQFWTNRTTAPSRGITIRDNVLNSGKGAYTQSIFMRNDLVDRGLAGDEMFYRDVTIEDNVIVNAHVHGITVGETDGLIIRNNTVVRNARSEGKRDNPGLWTPKILVSGRSRDVTITRNVTSRISGYDNQVDWDVNANLLVQDRARMEPGFYGVVFGMDALRDPTRAEAFRPAPGGPLDGTGIGASALSR